MGAYKSLLNIVVEHGFYSSGACSCLNFHPTEQTRRIFENAGLLQRKASHGIQIVYDESRLEALKLYAQDRQEPLCFEFKVYSSDPQFRSYTEPFSDMANGIIYLDNRAITAAEGNISLSAFEYVSKADLKKTDSDELKNIIHHKDRLLPPLFVLKIFAETERFSHIEQWLEPDLTSYSIVFNARQTFWKYYLLGNMARKSSYIFDPDHQVEFDTLGETSLPDQRVALTFRSKQSIPLNEHYDFRFQLKERAPGGGNVLINRLPVACITQTGREVVTEQRMVVSEIYINS